MLACPKVCEQAFLDDDFVLRIPLAGPSAPHLSGAEPQVHDQERVSLAHWSSFGSKAPTESCPCGYFPNHWSNFEICPPSNQCQHEPVPATGVLGVQPL